MVRRDPPPDFLSSGPLVPFETDRASGELLWVGAQVENLLGLSAEEVDPANFWSTVVVPDDARSMTSARARAPLTGGGYTVDYRVERADGRVLWVSEIGSALENEDGVPVVRGYLVDVTDRKRQEVALWKSEERLRALLRHAPDALVLTDESGNILNLNDQAELLIGYPLSEVAGSSIEHIVPVQLRARLTELRSAFERDPERRTLIDGHGFAVEHRDGSLTSVALSMSLVRAPHGATQIMHSFRDLTAQERARAQERIRPDEVHRVANAMPALVSAASVDHRYRFVNDAYADWLGWERRQIEGRSMREVMGERLFAYLQESIEEALNGSAAHFRGEMFGPSGDSFPADISVVPQFDDVGHVHGYYVVIFDVTREVQAGEADRRQRAELAHVGRLATLGELAASLAHELNQPLSAIVSNAEAASRFLGREDPDVAEARGALMDIASDGKRAGDVIASMRQLLERGEARRETLDLGAVVDEVFALLNSEAISRRVRLTQGDEPAEAPEVRGDAIQMKQVLLNLVINAIEAASPAQGPPGLVRVETTVMTEHVELAVRDDGSGLGDRDPEELFAPFMSRRTGGLGMGLAISRTIVEAHGGSLTAANAAESGAVFLVRLPRGAGEVEELAHDG
ncbi:MAG: PAS domain S-box protein [Gemmatimonadota bacterium]